MKTEKIDLVEKLSEKHPDTMITTTKGMMRVGDLVREVNEFENNNELTYAIEYWDGKELVHRSVHVQLKEGNEAESVAASF